MKVLVVCGVYKKNEKDNTNQFVHNQVKAIASKGIDIVVMSLDMRSIRRKRKLGFYSYKYDDITVYQVSIPCGPLKSILHTLSIYGANKCYKMIEKYWGKPDIIHSHFFYNTYPIINIANKNNVPVVLTEHASLLMSGNRSKENENLARKTYSQVNKIVCVSGKLKQSINEFFNKEVYVIPNILPDYFCIYRSDKMKKSFNFISVGNFIYRKRFDLTIKSFSKFVNKYPNSTLTIVGDGNLKEELNKLVKKLNIQDKVSFLGKVENSKLVKLYNESSCFILPSDYETFGVVYIEAMACGLPTIATKCGGPEDIIKDYNGLLVDKDNSDKLLEAMFYIYENYNKYDKNKISKDTIDKYGQETICNSIIDIYNNLIEEVKSI